jgi:hypothetical protein
MLSPAWIQTSFGKKAKAWLPKSGLCAPTPAIHSVAEAGLAITPAKRAATANEAVLLKIFLCNSCIVIHPCRADFEPDWHWLPPKVNPRVVNFVFPSHSRLIPRKIVSKF